MKVHELLKTHCMEIVQTIAGDFLDLTDEEVMFRVDSPRQNIIRDRCFTHLPAKASKSAGIGGIYFWLRLEDALKYAAEDYADSVFMVTRPNAQSESFHFSIDFLLSRRDHQVVCDTYLYGVNTYTIHGIPDPRHEFVKAGSVGQVFVPTALAIIQKRNT